MSKHGNKMMHMQSTEFITDYVFRFFSSLELSPANDSSSWRLFRSSCSHLTKTQKIKGQSFLEILKRGQ